MKDHGNLSFISRLSLSYDFIQKRIFMIFGTRSNASLERKPVVAHIIGQENFKKWDMK